MPRLGTHPARERCRFWPTDKLILARQRWRVPSASPPPKWVLQRRREVGEHIRAARIRAGLTQERVALAAEIDRSSVVRIEQGQQSPTLDTLIRLARVIGVPLSEFVK